MASRAWLPGAARPSSQRTTTPSSAPSIATARAPLRRCTPRLRSSSSSAAATSGSFWGSTWWRDTISVTWLPNEREHVDELHAGHARPDHDEVLRPGRGRIGVASGQHPLAVDVGPVGETGTAARAQQHRVGVELHARRRRCRPPRSGARPAARVPARCGRPGCRAAAAWPRSSLPLDGLDARAEGVRLDRRRRGGEAHLGVTARPRPGRRRWRSWPWTGCSPSRWAAPPITSCSMMVTSAPSRAAWVAAVLPGRPPPMITKRSAIGGGYRPAVRPRPALRSLMAVALQSAWSCPAPCSPGRPMPSPTASTGAASSPDLRWWPARSSRRPPTSCSAPPAPTPPSAAAWARGAPADRCAATATRSSAARSTAPTPALRARSRAAGGRPTGRASAAARPATTWTATSPAAACSCGGSGICSGGCNGTAVRLRQRSLRPPQGGLHRRSATATATTTSPASAPSSAGSSRCTPPWKIEPSCSSSAVAPTTTPAPTTAPACSRPRRSTRSPATGTATAARHRVPTTPNGRWTLRQTITAGTAAPGHLRPPGRRPPRRRRLERRRQDSIGIVRDGHVAPLRQPVGHRSDHELPVRRRPPTSPSSATGTATAPTASASSAAASWYLRDSSPARRRPRLPVRPPATPRRRRLERRRRRHASACSAGDLVPAELALRRRRRDHRRLRAAGRPPGGRRLVRPRRRQHRRLPAVRGQVVPASVPQQRPQHPGRVRAALAGRVRT